MELVIIGIATHLTDPARIQRCDEALDNWVSCPEAILINTRPQIVTGLQLSPPSQK
jgi:hypothetical protein